MKDYEHVIAWLDYFNKNLPRSKGRKLAKEKCVFDPTLRELMDAAKSSGLEIAESNERARHPKRPFVRSGYVRLPKSFSKTKILYKISEKLVEKRAKRHKQ